MEFQRQIQPLLDQFISILFSLTENVKRLTKTLTMKWQKHTLIRKKIRESEHYMEIQDQGKLKLCSSYALTGGFPGDASGTEPACQSRRRKRGGFNPWVRKISWRRKQQSIQVFLPGASHGQRPLKRCSPQGCKGLGATETTQHACSYQLAKLIQNMTMSPLTAKGQKVKGC